MRGIRMHDGVRLRLGGWCFGRDTSYYTRSHPKLGSPASHADLRASRFRSACSPGGQPGVVQRSLPYRLLRVARV